MIQRWNVYDVEKDDHGWAVAYDDHIAAVNAVENLAYERGVKAGRALWIDDVGGRGR